MQTLVSVHDVTPAHRDRLDRAEALLQSAGVEHVSYLIVPDYHRANPIADAPDFAKWCTRPRPFSVEWVLHGYVHVDDRSAALRRGGPAAWLARKMMTAGEGEFLGLSDEQQRDRLARGRDVVTAVTGVVPRAFVAPAWLFNDALAPALSALGFRYTEDHWQIVDVQQQLTRRCPVVTWATRTTLRRIGSRVVCPLSFALFRRLGPIRIAIHPFDMDHPCTVDQVRRLVARALEQGPAVDYDALFRTELTEKSA